MKRKIFLVNDGIQIYGDIINSSIKKYKTNSSDQSDHVETCMDING